MHLHERWMTDIFALHESSQRYITWFWDVYLRLLVICILLYKIYDLAYHYSLIISALMRILVMTVGIIFREICIEPNLNFTLFIDSNMLLHNLKIARLIIQFLESQQRTLDNVQALVKRYISDITESNGNMLNINHSAAYIWAHTRTLQCLIMESIH